LSTAGIIYKIAVLPKAGPLEEQLEPFVDSLEEQVIAVVSRKKKLAPGLVTPESTFAELGIDSLDGIDLIFDFEDTFNIAIPDQVARQMKSVREVVDALRGELAKRGPAEA
jgi:acyl carrier protein